MQNCQHPLKCSHMTIIGRGRKSSKRIASNFLYSLSLSLILAILHKRVCVCVYILHVSNFTFGETKNFCSALVTHFVVGNLRNNERQFYCKFLVGVLTKLCLYIWNFYTMLTINFFRWKNEWIQRMQQIKLNWVCSHTSLAIGHPVADLPSLGQ